MKLTINQLAKTSGINTQTLRFYRESGILTPDKDDNNNYYYYGELDALDAIMAKRYRSMGMQIKTVKQSIDNFSAYDQSNWISCRIDQLEEQIKLLENELKHTKEIEYYLNYGIKNEGQTELVNFDKDVYSLYLFDKNQAYDNSNLIEKWSNAMPYTYPSIKISKEELDDDNKTDSYNVKIGLSCLKENLDKCNLPINTKNTIARKGLYIRTFIKINNPFEIKPSDLKNIKDYAKKHNFIFTDDSSGWILSTDNKLQRDYLALIRIPII